MTITSERDRGPLRSSGWIANRLEVSRYTALSILKSGDMPVVNIALPGDSKAQLRVYDSDFEAWLSSREMPADRRRKVPVEIAS